MPDAGDVMIAQLVDTDGNGPDPADEIVMGMYPTKLKPVWPNDFEHWGVKSHTVNTVDGTPSATAVGVTTTVGADHTHDWEVDGGGFRDGYIENIGFSGAVNSFFWDQIVPFSPTSRDALKALTTSPSQAKADLLEGDLDAKNTDDYFIDVEIYIPPT